MQMILNHMQMNEHLVDHVLQNASHRAFWLLGDKSLTMQMNEVIKWKVSEKSIVGYRFPIIRSVRWIVKGVVNRGLVVPRALMAPARPLFKMCP